MQIFRRSPRQAVPAGGLRAQTRAGCRETELGENNMVPQQPRERAGWRGVSQGARRACSSLHFPPGTARSAVLAVVGAALVLAGAGSPAFLDILDIDVALWGSEAAPWLGGALLLWLTGFAAGRMGRGFIRGSEPCPSEAAPSLLAIDAVERLGREVARRGLTGELERLMRKLRLDRMQALLMVVDIDRMRDVNAVYGYRVGDALLERFERRLEQLHARVEVTRRLGGDRFLLLASVVEEDGAQLAARLLARLRAPLHLGGLELAPKVSAGLARFPEHAQEAEPLLRSAELALDQAKLAGGNRLIVYDSRMDAAFRHRKLLEMQIKRGLERREFALHYQPQFDLASGRVTGVEALLRWPGRPGGALAPRHFIPIAETSGLIRPLGAWLIDEACAAARRWLDEGIAVTMCVNISVAQLRHQDVAGLAQRCLARHRLPASQLELELTESLFVDPAQTAIRRNIERLRKLGVRLAIDDFGTGYSSLAYLKRLPAERIKVDKAFVRGLGGDPTDEALMRTIIALGRLFGKRVLAEGVEDDTQRAFLLREGCDEAQGYLFARPLPEAECRRFLLRGAVPETGERAVPLTPAGALAR